MFLLSRCSSKFPLPGSRTFLFYLSSFFKSGLYIENITFFRDPRFFFENGILSFDSWGSDNRIKFLFNLNPLSSVINYCPTNYSIFVVLLESYSTTILELLNSNILGLYEKFHLARYNIRDLINRSWLKVDWNLTGCYSGQSGRRNFWSEWCYSGQNVGVIVTPL